MARTCILECKGCAFPTIVHDGYHACNKGLLWRRENLSAAPHASALLRTAQVAINQAAHPRLDPFTGTPLPTTLPPFVLVVGESSRLATSPGAVSARHGAAPA
jgi:hypothetical protein